MVSLLRVPSERGIGDEVDEWRGDEAWVDEQSPRVRWARGLTAALFWVGLLVTAASAVVLASLFLLVADPAGWLRFALGHAVAWLVASVYLATWTDKGRSWLRQD